MTLGQKIAKLRKSRGWTQGQFAEQVGVHPSHVTRWERDRNQPAVSALSKIAEALSVDLEELTGATPKRALKEVIGDDALLTQFRRLQDLDEQDRSTIMRVIDAFLTKRRMEQALGIA